MKRIVWITILAILAFASILIARLPMSWVAGFVPKNITCGEWSGTVWTGSCDRLAVQNVQMDSASWDIKALPLLKGRIAGLVDVRRGASYARGDIDATTSGNDITARNFQVDMPLDPTLIPQLPRNLSGAVKANLESIHIQKGVITAVQGQIDAQNLAQASGGQSLALGDYVLAFPAADPNAEPVGQLRSVSGPLNVQGTLKLTRDPGFVLEGLVAATPEANPELAKQLSYLGSPDAAGRRPFSLAATF